MLESSDLHTEWQLIHPFADWLTQSGSGTFLLICLFIAFYCLHCSSHWSSSQCCSSSIDSVDCLNAHLYVIDALACVSHFLTHFDLCDWISLPSLNLWMLLSSACSGNCYSSFLYIHGWLRLSSTDCVSWMGLVSTVATGWQSTGSTSWSCCPWFWTPLYT